MPDSPATSIDNAATTPAEKDQENAYLTGWKLFTTMFSLTFVAFLMLLDISIISTVSVPNPSQIPVVYLVQLTMARHRPYLKLHLTSIR
jgi:hypothetical protein